MTDDDELDHIVKNSQRVLRLNDQYENDPFVEEFTKGRSVVFVYGTYVLEGAADFLWMIHGKYSRKILYQITQAIFAGK